MPTIGGILNIARSAILAQQAAVEVAGHNIANATTDGYTRQELVLTESTPDFTPFGALGTGVTMLNIEHSRSALLDRDVRAQLAPSEGFKARSELLAKVEGIFGEPSDTGLASALDAFWNAWSGLAGNPSGFDAKAVVQTKGAALATRLNEYSSQLSALVSSTRESVIDVVSQIGRITPQIAALNKQITAMESNGGSANDLRDKRDLLIDQLGGLVPVTVIDRADGGNQVMLGGTPLVDGAESKSLGLSTVSVGGVTTEQVHFTGSADALRRLGGRLGALLDVANVDIPAAQAGLDALAAAIVTDVNAVHAAGWSPTDGFGVDFFDPASVTARTIKLSAEVQADPAVIAAGSVLNAPGNNATALAMAALRNFSASAPGNSFGGAYRSLVSTVAAAKSSADDSASVHSTLVSQATQRRQATTGVSTDEELISLMRHQQAYVAASKIIQTVDQMLTTILDLKR